MGRFNIDEAPRQKNTIQIKAIDNMINLDKPYSLSKLSYPATLYQIYVNACNVADVQVGTTSFPNQNYTVTERPDDDLTLRDVLGYMAELAGTFAKCNRTGAIELKWYAPTDLILTPENRFDFKPSDDLIQIKGVMFSTEDTTYLAGSEDYAIDLSENPLVSGEYSSLLNNIFNNVKETVFTPYTSNWQGNPAVQAGDVITQVDRDGKEYQTLITKSVYKYRGRGTLEARGLPEISRGYKGSTNRRIAQIKRKIDVEVGDKLTNLEQAILEATELITGELGGYVLKRENELLIMDNPDPELAQKIWRWNLAGLGYSSNGIDGPYELAMTMTGAINANFITTGLLSANMVQTGVLQSANGSTWINMDGGEFNFKNVLKWVNNQLLIEQGIIVIDKDKIRINHSGSGQYTDLRADGVFRQWPYGEGSYLNDIYVFTNIKSDNEYDDLYPIQINLPQRFRDREVEVLLINREWWTGSIGRMASSGVTFLITQIDMILNVENLILNTSNPRIIVNAGLETNTQDSDREREILYRDLTFDLIVIGK